MKTTRSILLLLGLTASLSSCTPLPALATAHFAPWVAPQSGALLQSTLFRSYITRWEGVTHLVIGHTSGEMTVGIGHNALFNTPAPVDGLRYSDAQVEAMYLADYAVALSACRKSILRFDDLPQSAQFVALSLVWCCGPTGYTQWSKLNWALSVRLYDTAAAEVLKSKWATQVSAERVEDHHQVLATLARDSLQHG